MNMKLLLIILAEAYFTWSLKALNSIRLNGIQCIPNEKWARDTNCSLKILSNRSVVLNGYTYLHRSVRAPKVNAKVEKWVNGFRPYLFNVWGDGCKVMENIRRQNRIMKMFLAMILDNSNLNHTCPFEGEIKFFAVDFSLGMIPSLVVSGTYRLTLTFSEQTKENVVFTLLVKGLLSSNLRE